MTEGLHKHVVVDLFQLHRGAALSLHAFSRWEHSSFSLKSPDFVHGAPQVAVSGIGQARIENNLLLLLICIKGKSVHPPMQCSVLTKQMRHLRLDSSRITFLLLLEVRISFN